MISQKLSSDTKLEPGRYRHYKGREYEVIGVARHTETDEVVVVYRYLYDDFGLSVRPLQMFTESVTVNGQSVPRFRYLSEVSDDPEEAAPCPS